MPRPSRPIGALSEEIKSRFWSKVDRRSKTECWNWKGHIYGKGYGGFHIKAGHSTRAHRVAVAISGREIPQGMVVDHICRNRLCVNPDHLRVITNQQNIVVGVGPTAVNSRLTHCPSGHPYDGQNLVITKLGYRRCRECNNSQRREARAAARQALAASTGGEA